MAEAFNVGKDYTLDINDPVLGVLRFKIITAFDSAPQYTDYSSKGIDGVPRFDNAPNGHRLSFTFDRADGLADAYFVGREAAYFSGQRVPLASITETITEVGGGVSSYRYTGVALKQSSSAALRGDAIVTSGIEAMASRRIKVG